MTRNAKASVGWRGPGRCGSLEEALAVHVGGSAPAYRPQKERTLPGALISQDTRSIFFLLDIFKNVGSLKNAVWFYSDKRIDFVWFQYLWVSEWVIVTHSSLTPWDPMDCSPPGPFVLGILQAGTLEWLAMPLSFSIPLDHDIFCTWSYVLGYFPASPSL